MLTAGIIPEFQAWANLVSSIAETIKSIGGGVLGGIGKMFGLGAGRGGGVQEAGAKGYFPKPEQGQKAEAAIDIRISSDQGSTPVIENVQKKAGEVNITAQTVGYLGAF